MSGFGDAAVWFCFVIFLGSGLPVPVIGDEELPGRDDFALLGTAGFCSVLGGTSGPVDRMKSAKSRSESSLAIGSRAGPL